MTQLAAGAVVAAVCALGGAAMPILIARIPEPRARDAEPTDLRGPEPTDLGPAPVKEPYRRIARTPGTRIVTTLGSAVAGALVGGSLGWATVLLVWVPLLPLLVGLALIDRRTRLLPTAVINPATVAVAVLLAVCWWIDGDTDAIVRAGACFVIGYLVFAAIWFVSPRSMGYGDVRLAGLIAPALGYLGWVEFVVGGYAGFLIGGVWGVAHLVSGRSGTAFAFGPFLVAGAVCGVVAGAVTGTVTGASG